MPLLPVWKSKQMMTAKPDMFLAIFCLILSLPPGNDGSNAHVAKDLCFFGGMQLKASDCLHAPFFMGCIFVYNVFAGGMCTPVLNRFFQQEAPNRPWRVLRDN
ncbi:MAG: hypothetical protein Q3990_08825 [Desulfovibrionaceae bacterium]|nr:hypothetical protein [Desulfovibrionaceae bacterium]